MDATAAAHVRWGDADAMREVVRQRAPDSARTWSDTARVASVAEAALLRRADGVRTRVFMRPFGLPDPLHHGTRVVPLGVSATRAALLARTLGDDDEDFRVTYTQVSKEDEPERFASSEGRIVDTYAVAGDERSDGESPDAGIYRLVRDPPVAPGALSLWTCAVSRGDALEWTCSEQPYEGGEPATSALYGDDLALVSPEGAVRILQTPSGTETQRFVIEWGEAAAAAADATCVCALNARFAVVARGRAIAVVRRADGAQQRYAHDAPVTCVHLDACTSSASLLLMCGDAAGRVLGFALSGGAEKQLFAHEAPFVRTLARADVGGVAFDAAAPLRALAFGGSRIAVASEASLVVVDRSRASALMVSSTPSLNVGPEIPRERMREGAAPRRSIEHHVPFGGESDCYNNAQIAAVALWGDAVVVLSDADLLYVYDATSGERVARHLNEQSLRKIVPLPANVRARCVVAACDQIAVLLSNGILALVDIDV